MKKITLLLLFFCSLVQAQVTELALPYSVKNVTNKPIDYWYYNPATLLPWENTTAILTSATRVEGQLYYVSGGDVYTFKGGIADANLVLFGGGGSGVTTFSTGTTGLTPNTATTGAITLGGTLGLANGGTNKTAYNAGQLLFGSFNQSTNLFWDNTNNRLGINTSSPTKSIQLNQTSTTDGFLFSGTSIGGTNTGTGVYMGMGYNQTNNKQFWIGDPDYIGLTTGYFLRAVIGSGGLTVDAVRGDNTTTARLSLGGPAGITLTSLATAGIVTNTAAGLIGTTAAVPIANGGTNSTTAQGAINTLAGAVTTGQYLRGNGTNVVMSAIQAGDVPTLNQNTTGSAATWTTGRTIGMTGDVTWTSPAFNGSANVTAAATLSNTGVTAGTYNNVTVDAKGRVTSASNIAVSSKEPAKIYSTSPINFYGDSFTVGQNATSTDYSYAEIIKNSLGSPSINNYAASGQGVRQAVVNAFTNVNVSTNQNPTVTLFGFNDLRRNGNNVTCNPKTLGKLKAATRSIIVNTWLSSVIGASSSGASTTGTWTTFTNTMAKSNYIGSSGYSSSTNGSTLTYTFTGDNLVIGTFVTDQSTTFGGDFTYSIDGITTGSYSGKNLTDGISDGTGDNSLIPNTIILTNLGGGTHTLVITVTDASPNVVRIDYFGTLKNPSKCVPVLVGNVPKMNAAGYAQVPNSASDAVMLQGSTAFQEVVNEFANYPVYLSDINSAYNVVTGIDTDNIHPNNVGHKQIATKFLTYTGSGFDLKSSTTGITNPIALTDGNGNKSFFGNDYDVTALSINRNPFTGAIENSGRASSQITMFGLNGEGSIKFYATNTNGDVPSNNFNILGNGNVEVPNGNLNILTGSLNTSVVNASSTVTANSFVKSGGTSSQYLMADGSVSTGDVVNPLVLTDGTGNSVYFGSYFDTGSFAVNRNPITGSFIDVSKASSQITMYGGSGDGAVRIFTTDTNGAVPVNNFSILGDGNVTVPNGGITANSFIKAGGTSTQYLMADGSVSTGSGGSGDMILASAQTNTGAKTFNDNTLLLNNVAGTFASRFTNTNTAAQVYTLPNATGTVSLTGLAETFSAVKTFSAAPAFNVLPTGTAVSNIATASTLAARDASNRLLAANHVDGFTTTATAAGTTTLNVTSNRLQRFTGTTTQTVVLPTTSVLAGQDYLIINASTGNVTVNASGGTTVQVMAANTILNVIALVATPTTNANWQAIYEPFNGVTSAGVTSLTGTANQVNVSASTGAVTLSLPQNIHNAATPTFAGLLASAASFDLANTTATTLNIGGASTNFNLGGTPTTSLTANLFANATASGQTKTINLGTNGLAGSNTNIFIGSGSSKTLTYLDTNDPNGSGLVVTNYGGGQSSVGINNRGSSGPGSALKAVGTGISNTIYLDRIDADAPSATGSDKAQSFVFAHEFTGNTDNPKQNELISYFSNAANGNKTSVFSINQFVSGTLQNPFQINNGETRLNHLGGLSATPSISIGSSSGVSSVSIVGTDVAGTITVTTNTSTNRFGQLAVVTFSNTYTSTPYVVVSNADVNITSTSRFTSAYISSVTPNGFSLHCGTNLESLSASTTYKWNYIVVGGTPYITP